MNNVSQTNGLVHLVDLDGYDVPLNERFDGPEPDPTDPAEWPAWTDDWFWTTTDDASWLEDTQVMEPVAPDEYYVWPQREHYVPTAEDLSELAEWSAGAMGFPRAMGDAERKSAYLAAVEEWSKGGAR